MIIKSTCIDKLKLLKVKLHEEIIEQLKDVYNNEHWKYTFIKNSLEKHNKRIQYHQLKKFEDAEGKNEEIMLLMILEITSSKKEFIINFFKNGGNNIRLKTN